MANKFNTQNLSINSKETKQQYVYSSVKNAIINNEYLPGTMLTERFLCDNLGVSRTPVREALRQLANEGMVDIVVGRGACVANISFENMVEIFEMREALEKMAIKLFVLKDDGKLTEKLKQCFEEQKIYENRDSQKFMEKDMEFHFLIAEGAKNKRLYNSLEMIYDQIKLLAISAEKDENLRNMAYRHHESIINAITLKDVESAENAIVKHIIEVKKYHASKYMIHA